LLDFCVQQFLKDVGQRLKSEDYLLADTRIPNVSLYDHLSLTAGFAVAMTRELRLRGCDIAMICGEEIDEFDLLPLARLCGWLHDIGKAYLGETEYRHHVQRGVKWVEEWLGQQGVTEPLFSIILNAVARHHLRDSPQTPMEKVICLADSYASAGDRPELAKAETETQLKRAVREILAMEQEIFGGEKPVCLLLGDVDSIKGFVYEGVILPEIRGGSQILVNLEEEIRELFRKELCEECLIYCGGGSFLAIVPASEVKELKEKVECLYLAKTKIATITVVASQPVGYIDLGRGLPPYDEASVTQLKGIGISDDLLFSHYDALVSNRTERKNFGELISSLSADLQRAKREKTFVPFLSALPFHQRCQSCGKRASGKRDGVTDEWLCEICFKKREMGRKERIEILREFAEWLSKEKGIKLSVEERRPKDLDTLARPEGKVAFLYADGNNMGDLLQKAKTPAQYRRISEVLTIAVKESLFEALVDAIGKENLTKSEMLPFEIIAIGGDDVTVIARARYGWKLALKLLERFEQHQMIRKLKDELKEPLTISAGLVIVDVKYPVRFMQSLAESLLKEAKRLAREKKGESTLCHLWLRVPIASEDARTVLEELYLREEGLRGEKYHLTARPYTLKQASQLTQISRNLRSLSFHQRRILAEALEKGIYTSLNIALYQAHRLREQREKVLESFRELGRLIAEERMQEKFFFWQRMDGEWKTALLDVLELLELEGD